MFGMSVFQFVLERLKAEDDEEDATVKEAAMSRTIPGLNAGFVGNLTSSAAANDSSVARAYFDTAGEDMLAPPKPVQNPVMPDHLACVNPKDIATELSFGENETLATLSEKRRRFATENHPDRHHPDFRANATIRMKIANMLIDEALRRLRMMAGN